MNGVDVEIQLKPLKFNLQDVLPVNKGQEQDVDSTKIEDNEEVTTNDVLKG